MNTILICCFSPLALLVSILLLAFNKSNLAVLSSLMGGLPALLVSFSVLLELGKGRAPYNIILYDVKNATFGAFIYYLLVVLSLSCFTVCLIARKEERTLFRLKKW